MINKRNESMRLNTAIITFITVLTASFAFTNTLGLSDNGDGTWNVNYVSDGEIAGFQFNVDGTTINSASGGESGDSGMMISSSATTVLAFSLGTPPIPEGEGVLVGIKGQYLIFESGHVFNVRKHSGYLVKFSIM